MHVINWFEIPATDFVRACHFYETVLATTLRPDTDLPGMRMAVFEHANDGVGGAIVAADHMKPSATGTLVYLHTTELDAALARTLAAGGAVLMPKTLLSPDIGHIAVIRDSEGNSVGLHMPPA
jgi:hypothetical protein